MVGKLLKIVHYFISFRIMQCTLTRLVPTSATIAVCDLRKLPKNLPSPEIYIGLHILNLELHLLKFIFRAAETNAHQYKFHIFAWLVHLATSWCAAISHCLHVDCFPTVVYAQLTDYKAMFTKKPKKEGNLLHGRIVFFLQPFQGIIFYKYCLFSQLSKCLSE